jgi:hypothetical protein
MFSWSTCRVAGDGVMSQACARYFSLGIRIARTAPGDARPPVKDES